MFENVSDLEQAVRDHVVGVVREKGVCIDLLQDDDVLRVYGFDSLDITTLIVFLADELGVDVLDFDVEMSSFESIDTITSFARTHWIERGRNG